MGDGGVGRVQCVFANRPICIQTPFPKRVKPSRSRIRDISKEGSRLTKMTQNEELKAEKPSVTMPGTVEKIIPSVDPSEPEKAQIGIEGADHLYREIRVENTLQDKNGKPVELKPGAQVDVTIQADVSDTQPK